MSAVPEGWVEAELGEVWRGKRRSSVLPAKEPDWRFELYSVPSFETGVPERLYGSEIGSSKQRVAPGSVLLCRINPRINRVWVVGEAGGDPQIASTEWICLPRVVGMTPRFAMHALQTPKVRRHLTSCVSGVGGSLMRVRMDALWRTKIPLAPLPEQRRIVAKIESLFAKLDEGVAALKRAAANLKRYRTSVLKAAVEGRLTEQWRRENPPEQTGEELLRRILAERRKRWEEEQLAKFEAKGKKPPKNWKAKYKEPATPDTSGLPELPKGWCWATVAMLIREPLRNGKSAKASKDGTGVRTLTLSAVTEGDFSEHNTKVTTADPKKVRDLWLAPEDILVERSNTPELVGLACMYRGPPAYAIFPDLLIRVRCVRRVAAAFVELCLQSPDARSYLRKQARGSAGSMPKISQNMLAELTLPVPPRSEQDEILKRLGSLVASAADLMSGKVAAATRGVVTLRQSTLRRAFEGRLVPQDANDEPASDLLERLRAEKEANESGRRSAEPKRQRRGQVA